MDVLKGLFYSYIDDNEIQEILNVKKNCKSCLNIFVFSSRFIEKLFTSHLLLHYFVATEAT